MYVVQSCNTEMCVGFLLMLDMQNAVCVSLNIFYCNRDLYKTRLVAASVRPARYSVIHYSNRRKDSH